LLNSGRIYNTWKYIHYNHKCDGCGHKTLNHRSKVTKNEVIEVLKEKQQIEQDIQGNFAYLESVLINSAKLNHFVQCNSITSSKDVFVVGEF
jgi:hypothetical protein